MFTPKHAEAIARDLLAGPLPRRWAHTRGVATKAAALSPILGADAGILTAAAWLHDIGYAPVLAQAGTGFHPLDGARHLRDSAAAPVSSANSSLTIPALWPEPPNSASPQS